MGDINKKQIHTKDVIARMAADIEERNAKLVAEQKRKSILEEVANLTTEEINQLRDKIFGGMEEQPSDSEPIMELETEITTDDVLILEGGN